MVTANRIAGFALPNDRLHRLGSELVDGVVAVSVERRKMPELSGIGSFNLPNAM